MRKQTITILVLLSIAHVLFVRHNLRSQNTPATELPTVVFGTMAGDRGTIVSIPVYFTAGKGAVSRVSLGVDFISNSVTFEKVDSVEGTSDQAITLKVEPELLPKDSKGLPRTRLKIEVSAPKGSGTKTLPDGLWMFLNFRLSPEAKPFAVGLQPNSALGFGSSGSPVKISAEPGKVIVAAENEPTAGCFFFTH